MTKKTDKEFIEKLEEEGGKRGLPRRFLEFYQRLFQIQFKAEQQIGKVKVSLNRAAISERIERGLPLVNYKELDIDWSLLKDIFTEVIATFSDYTDLFGELPKNLSKKNNHPSLPKKMVEAWFNGTMPPDIIENGNPDEHLLLQAIIHATLKPFLVSKSKALSSQIDQERWRRNYCPVCGGRADFAFLEKEYGGRWLLCSRCDTEWAFQRLQCPYCGTEDQNALTYFTDEEGKYRLHVCEECHRYIKTVDLRAVGTDIPITLCRILTLDMDIQAQEKGYQPPHSETSI